LKAAFLDRDGTVIQDMHYCSTPEAVRVLPNAVLGLKMLKDAGFALFIITNQSGTARGYLSLERLAAVNRRMEQRLGLRFRQIAFCPHHPGERCGCRKPKPGMILSLMRRWPEIDPARSITVGDKITDVIAGIRAGTKTALIGENKSADPQPDLVAKDLLEVALWAKRL